jgi:hypothetical protein
MKLFETPQIEHTSDDYYTPPEIFNRLGLVFDLDVAAPPNGAPYVPCKKYLTQAQDGLVCNWFGSVWMNPPYSNPTPWVDRFIEHAKGVALLPTSNGRWLTRLWDSEAQFKLLEPVKFYSPNGIMPQSIPNRCWLWAFGEKEIKALGNFGKIR